MACGRYCFVQFQNAELATRAITIFDDTDAGCVRRYVKVCNIPAEVSVIAMAINWLCKLHTVTVCSSIMCMFTF